MCPSPTMRPCCTPRHSKRGRQLYQEMDQLYKLYQRMCTRNMEDIVTEKISHRGR